MQPASPRVSSVRLLSLKMESQAQNKNVEAQDNGQMPLTVAANDVLELSLGYRYGRRNSMSQMKRVTNVLVA